MLIRKACFDDIPELARILEQVLLVHHNGRPDLFKSDMRKYTDNELKGVLSDTTRPVFVAVSEEGKILGYAFCIFEQFLYDNIMKDVKTLYIDDLGVDEAMRGRHIGTALYRHVLDYAKDNGCYRVTLNVYSFNKDAVEFYESLGLVPYKVGMEQILDER